MGKNNIKIALGLLGGLLGKKIMTGPTNSNASGNKNIIRSLDNIKARR